MKILIGIGNPGERYEHTRHNLGFMLIDHFFRDFEPVDDTVWKEEKKFKSLVAEIIWQRKTHQGNQASMEKVLLVKPMTYVNNSGMALQLVADFYKVEPEDIWVFHDDLDISLGMLKIRFGGASAGHHGVDSIIEALSTDKFWRFRLGIGENPSYTVKHAEDFVLGTFTGPQSRKVKELLKRGGKAIELALEKNLHAAMNRFNTK